MAYLRPFASVTFSNRNALRWDSGSPRNCRRTSGCSSVSLLIGTVTRTSLPAFSSPSTYWPSVGQYDVIPCLRDLLSTGVVDVWLCRCQEFHARRWTYP